MDFLVINGIEFFCYNIIVCWCFLCEKLYDFDDCESFKRKFIVERRMVFMEKFLCFGCYGRNYVFKDCKKKRECKKCKKLYFIFLYIDGFIFVKESSVVEELIDKFVKVNNVCIDIF